MWLMDDGVGIMAYDTWFVANGYFVIVFFVDFLRLERCLPILSPSGKRTQVQGSPVRVTFFVDL